MPPQAAQPASTAPSSRPTSNQTTSTAQSLPHIQMTARYRNDEWESLIAQMQRSVVPSDDVCRVPKFRSDVHGHDVADVGERVSTAGSELAKCIDHTLLKLDATPAQIDALCSEARREGFKCVCVRVNYVARAVANLRGSDVLVACVIGFPEGTQALSDKANEATQALSAGAAELDIVLNYPRLLTTPPQYESLYLELATLRSVAPSPTVLKLILETSQLQSPHITAAVVLASAARFDLVKTSTGFRGRGASEEDVRLMRAAVRRMVAEGGGREMGVKASGGIKGLRDAVRMFEAGATRIGTSSGVWIMQEAREVVARQERGLGLDDGVEGGSSRDGEGRPGGGMTRLYTDNEPY